MKTIKNLLAVLCIAFALIILSAASVKAQLLINEVESDPPTQVGDRCQYVELRGAPGAAVPANTYFISINSDNLQPGFLNAAVNIGGRNFGSNGTITLLNTVQGDCPNRTYSTGTTIVNYSAGLTLGQGAEGFYIVQSATTLFAGQDLDANNDGTTEVALTYLDGFNYITNPDEQFVYGPGPILNTTFGGDVPDAAVRFSGNNATLNAAAFYFGELAADPEETTVFAAPLSANFPVGGALTPGTANAGGTVGGNDVRADFDGDGRTDVSVFRPSEGNFYIQRSNAGFMMIRFGASTDVITPGDYDGDGKTDAAVFRNGLWYILRSNNGTVDYVTFGLATDIPVPADYDGDDRTDVAVFRPSNGFWYRLNSSNGQFVAIPFGQNGDVPVTGDFDGDNRADLTVFRNGQWITQRSSGGASFTNFGVATDRLVPADYDGDGKDDIAVFRDGTWYILRSSNGGISFIQFGFGTDVPVPGDYDGDGRDDQAVYRNGVWYLNRSTGGFGVSNFGLASDSPIPNEYLP